MGVKSRMNSRSFSLFVILRMGSLIEKLLLVLDFEEGLGSESKFEVVRHFVNCEGEDKIVRFDPRMSLDDQDIKLMKLNVIWMKVI